MRFTAERDAVMAALKIVKPALGKDPATSCVHINATADSVKFTCTNIELTIATEIQARVEAAGIVLVGLGAFFATLRPLVGGGALTVSDKTDYVDLESGGMSARLNKPRNANWPFLTREEGTQFKIDADHVWHMRKLAPFVAVPPQHPQCQGVHLGESRALATDGIGMAVVELPDVDFPGITVPLASLTAVLTNADGEDVIGDATDKQCTFTVGQTSWTTSLVAGNFPTQFLKYVVPAAKSMTLEVEDLVQAIGVATSMQPEQAICISPKVEDNECEFSSTGEAGAASHTIVMDGDVDWDFKIDPKQLTAILHLLREPTITLDFTEPLRPIIVREGDFTCFFMPIRG